MPEIDDVVDQAVSAGDPFDAKYPEWKFARFNPNLQVSMDFESWMRFEI